MQRLFSGIQPTGDIHLGNYMGAMRGWLSMQTEYDSLFCVVDSHAITTKPLPTLSADTRTVAALYLACGIDTKHSTIFVQSHVPAHAELAWLLQCNTPISWLYKMTQFKDKEDSNIDISAALLAYPVLMAADILLYQTNVVPVGNDQTQHVQLCRDIARRFNNTYGDTFVMPTASYQQHGARIMSLQDGTKKMSKSEANGNSRINLLDNPDTVAKKIKSATTDSVRGMRFEEGRPEARNLLTLYMLIANKTQVEAEALCGDMGTKDFKDLLTESVNSFLEPIAYKYKSLIADEFYLDTLLKHGKERAIEIAYPTLKNVKQRMSFML